MEYFRKNGTKSIDKYSKNNLLTVQKSFFQTIQAEIYKLFKEVNYKVTEKLKDVNIDYYKLSKKLKGLIYLSFSQETKITTKNKKYEKIFLINKDWLQNYNYSKINDLIKQSDTIKDHLNYNNSKLIKNIENLDNIISVSEKKNLMEIDKKIYNKRNKIEFNAKSEQL